jgi:hypothetical protein
LFYKQTPKNDIEKSTDPAIKNSKYVRQDSCSATISNPQSEMLASVEKDSSVQTDVNVRNQLGKLLVDRSFLNLKRNVKKVSRTDFSEIIRDKAKINYKGQEVDRKKISEGWKKFWIAVLITVLVIAFLVCGALWPDAYVVWFGLTALIAITGFSTSVEPPRFIERVFGFLFFVLWALFYLWIYVAFPIFWHAILIQLALYGTITLIVLIVYLVKKD